MFPVQRLELDTRTTQPSCTLFNLVQRVRRTKTGLNAKYKAVALLCPRSIEKFCNGCINLGGTERLVPLALPSSIFCRGRPTNVNVNAALFLTSSPVKAAIFDIAI